MVEVEPGRRPASRRANLSNGMRSLSSAEIDAVAGGDSISCIWVCRQVPEPNNPPAASIGFDSGGPYFDCELVCGGNFEPGGDSPPA